MRMGRAGTWGKIFTANVHVHWPKLFLIASGPTLPPDPSNHLPFPHPRPHHIKLASQKRKREAEEQKKAAERPRPTFGAHTLQCEVDLNIVLLKVCPEGSGCNPCRNTTIAEVVDWMARPPPPPPQE